jgi:hypothetical protein
MSVNWEKHTLVLNSVYDQHASSCQAKKARVPGLVLTQPVQFSIQE